MKSFDVVIVGGGGSTTSVPPIPGLREAGCLTHVGALVCQTRPESLVIVGAGPLGLEFGQMYARFGTRVTILERASVVFPTTEARLADVSHDVGGHHARCAGVYSRYHAIELLHITGIARAG